jgi:hypothetical protein
MGVYAVAGHTFPVLGSACGWHLVIIEDGGWVGGVFDGNNLVSAWSPIEMWSGKGAMPLTVAVD